MPSPTLLSSNGVAKNGVAAAMSVGRALQIMQLLAGDPHGLRLAEIAGALKADRSNVLRILAEMERGGFVYQDPVSDRYRLTFLVTVLGFRQLEAAGVGDWVDPILGQLAGRTQELVRMTVADGGVLRWIAKAQGANSALILDPEMGGEVVLHATATGKAWLAALSDEEAVRLALGQGFRPATPSTIRTVEALRDELAATRERGYATTLGEAEENTLAVAAVIRARVPRVPRVPSPGPGRAGQPAHPGRAAASGEGTPAGSDGGGAGGAPTVPVGTVSVAGPILRVTPERLHEWAPEVVRAAALLGETWGPYVLGLMRAADGGPAGAPDGAARGRARGRGWGRSHRGSRR